MRSAMAPTIRAGVMMANISWYIENTLWETQYGVVGVRGRADALEHRQARGRPGTALPGAKAKL